MTATTDEAPNRTSPLVLQRRVLTWLRRAVMLAALGGVGYIALRFDSVVVPAGTDPELGLAPGERLVVDRHPRKFHIGDHVFHVDADGGRGLLRIVEVPAALDVAGSTASLRAVGLAGPPRELSRDAIVGRVVLVWPF